MPSARMRPAFFGTLSNLFVSTPSHVPHSLTFDHSSLPLRSYIRNYLRTTQASPIKHHLALIRLHHPWNLISPQHLSGAHIKLIMIYFRACERGEEWYFDLCLHGCEDEVRHGCGCDSSVAVVVLLLVLCWGWTRLWTLGRLSRVNVDV